MNVLAAGQHIADRYQLDRRIAVGGMGEVWEASDTRLGRSVAVKVLRPELSDDPEFLHRFRIEARTVASLDHSGIAAVHDYGEDDSPTGDRRTAYLVMELVRGEPLSTLISRGPLDPYETLRLLEEAAWALQAAHERGFVHRDVKPGNILVRTDGLVKLTDFGIAKAADAVPVTRSGMVMGTAHYIAPEQASGAEAGPAGDVYSLGIVGYECLAGQRPFRAESAVAVAMMQVREEPPPLPASVPPATRELIEAVLVKDPELRYATGGEFALAVAAVRRGDPLPAPGSPTGSATAVPVRSTPPPLPARPAAPVADPPPADVAPRPAQHREHDHEAHDDTGYGYGYDYAPDHDRGYDYDRGYAYDQYDYREREPATQTPPAPRTPARRAAAHARPAAPLQLQPRSGSGRTLLLVLFVLLTVAAVVVGVFLFQELRAGDAQQPDSPPRSAPAGTVTSREGLLAGSAVPDGPPRPVIATGTVR
jgi:hypothetical protein